MKILFDATPMVSNKTGIAYYIERLMLEMADAHPETEFVGFYFNFLGKRNTSHLPTRPNLRYIGASIIPSKIVFQLRRWGIEFPIELMSLTRADFIIYGNFLGYPSLFKTPSAMVIHDLTYLDLPEYVSAKLRSDLVRFVPTQIKRSKFLITVSEFSKKRIQEEYKPDMDIVVTPIPAPKQTVVPAQKRAQLLAEQGITKPYILFVGTIEPRKNLTQLIAAYRALPAEIQDKYSLVIAGRIGWNCEPEKAALAQAKADGIDVHHLGYVSDELLATLYQSASLFSTASHYEGFGMPILEAMTCGVPCVISDIPVFHEVAGSAAEYFDQANVQTIADTIAAVLGDSTKYAAMQKRSSEQAATFSWRTVAEKAYAAIKRTLDEQK